eukprot:gene3100-6089_t
MSLKDFRIQETLGKGSFATVYKVTRKSDGKIYALKRAKIGKMSKKEISDALNEIRFLASIRHNNIVGFLEAFLEDNDTELCIIMEYCGCGDLAAKVERYKKKREYIDEDVIWRYLIQTLKAIQCLHEKGICHRDLKTSNCFLGDDGAVKVGDMNVSKRLKDGDMWALGCMIYELCALKPPFLGDSFPALKRAVTAGRFQPIPRKYSDPLHRVVNALIRVNPRERPSATVLLRSPELAAKLQLDDGSTSFAQAQPSARENLLETIKVPQNMKKLNTALPKPCYPDVRPNSPTSWTIAEQKQSKMNVDNVDQRRPVALAGGRLPLIDEENYTGAVLRKEVNRANEGLPERNPLHPLVPVNGNGNGNGNVSEKSKAVAGAAQYALPPAKPQGHHPSGMGYRQQQQQQQRQVAHGKYQQQPPSSKNSNVNPNPYTPHRLCLDVVLRLHQYFVLCIEALELCSGNEDSVY